MILSRLVTLNRLGVLRHDKTGEGQACGDRVRIEVRAVGGRLEVLVDLDIGGDAGLKLRMSPEIAMRLSTKGCR